MKLLSLRWYWPNKTEGPRWGLSEVQLGLMVANKTLLLNCTSWPREQSSEGSLYGNCFAADIKWLKRVTNHAELKNTINQFRLQSYNNWSKLFFGYYGGSSISNLYLRWPRDSDTLASVKRLMVQHSGLPPIDLMIADISFRVPGQLMRQQEFLLQSEKDLANVLVKHHIADYDKNNVKALMGLQKWTQSTLIPATRRLEMSLTKIEKELK